jgi:hypothetical protein
MFEIQPAIRHLSVDRAQVASISNSINHPQVAVPTKPTQKAEAFVVTLREAGDLVVVFICLWLDLNRELVVYGAAPVPAGEGEELYVEAIAFCESMGFIMEEMHFAQLDAASQEELLVRLPPFGSERRLAASLVEPEATPGGAWVTARPEPTGEHGRQVSAAELDKLGRLLARF